MKKSKSVSVAVIVLSILALVIATVMIFAAKPNGPLEGSRQVLLVLADDHDSSDAEMWLFEEADAGWVSILSCPAVIGKNGAGWGIGTHDRKSQAPDDPVKMEGDLKSPEGVFPVLEAYGYPPESDVHTRLLYTEINTRWICCDDRGSKHYNRVFDYRDKGLDKDALPSHEDMMRDDDLYKYTILVGHNYWSPAKGAGSCIFIHLWNGPESYTAGCTAIAELDMLTLLQSLDAASNPVMVLLTRGNYKRLKDQWSLPDV